MLQLIHAAVISPDPALTETVLTASRLLMAKRLWRGIASDGAEFGFELEAPLKNGDVFWQTTAVRYVLRQEPESLVEISLDLAPSAAAGIGWAVGNMHLELGAEPARLLALDEPAVRQLLERLKVSYQPVTAVFRPGRFARGNLPTQELGPSHKH